MTVDYEHHRWYSIIRTFDDDGVQTSFLVIINSSDGLIHISDEDDFRAFQQENW